jgi:ribonuclease T2
MKKLRKIFAGSVFLFASAAVMAQFHRGLTTGAPVTLPPFDHYVLSLSWAPGFCAALASQTRDCASARRTGFVLHGLWPELPDGIFPAPCGPSKRVPKAAVKMMLRSMPDASRIQEEWVQHGMCTGLSPADYFGRVLEARAAVQLPVQITSLEDAITQSPEQIETQFAQANPAFPEAAFRTSCHDGALQEIRVCFDKAVKPQTCPAREPECTLPGILIRPPR